MSGSRLRLGKERSYGTLLLICCSVSFFCFFGSYLRIPVLPLYAASLGAGTVEVGIINACFLLTAGLLSIPLGILSDRLGRRSLILAGLAVLSGSSFLLWFSTTPLQMMGIYLLFGVGLAAFAPTMMSYVADFTPATHLGRAYGWYTMAIYSAMTLGPAVGGFLGHALGLKNVFLVAGGIIILMAGVVLPFLPLLAAHPHEGDERPALSAQARELLANRGYLASLLATLGSCFGFGVFIAFFPLFAHAQGIEAGGPASCSPPRRWPTPCPVSPSAFSATGSRGAAAWCSLAWRSSACPRRGSRSAPGLSRSCWSPPSSGSGWGLPTPPSGR